MGSLAQRLAHDQCSTHGPVVTATVSPHTYPPKIETQKTRRPPHVQVIGNFQFFGRVSAEKQFLLLSHVATPGT